METLPEDLRGYAATFFNELAGQEEEKGKAVGQLSREQIISSLEWSGYTAYQSFDNPLKYLRKYLNWYSEFIQPIPLHTSQISWTDIDLSPSFRVEMLHSPEEIAKDFSQYPPSEGEPIQPYAVLAWHGLSLSEIVQLKKTEVTDDGSKILVRTKKKEFEIENATELRILRDFASCKSYRKSAKGKLWVPGRTDRFLYKMVTDRDESGSMNTDLLSGRIFRASTRGGDRAIQRKYRRKSLYNAGLYHRILQEEERQGAPLSDEVMFRIADRPVQRAGVAKIFRASIEAYRKSMA